MAQIGVSHEGRPVGEFVYNAKLSFAKVDELRSLRASGWTYAALGKRYGVNQATIGKVAKGKAWVSPVAKSIKQATQDDLPAIAALVAKGYDPENGFMSQQGKNAVAGYEKALADVATIRRNTMDSAKNPAVLSMIAPVINARMQGAVDSINKHMAQESRRYQIETADSRAIVSLQDAAQNFDDDTRFASAIAVTQQETASLAKLNGWDENTARMQATKYQDTGWKMRLEAWRIKDPLGAFDAFQKHAGEISPLAREQMGSSLFHAAAPVMAQQINQAGGVGVVAPDSSEGDGQLPRGIRNNNPGNVIRTNTAWQGEMPSGSDPKYATFSTPEAGIRAMGKTLLTYQDKHGLNTIEGIVSRWAPATENDTAAYSATVAKALGVDRNAPIDLHDSDTLNKITKAMIRVENGPEAARIAEQEAPFDPILPRTEALPSMPDAIPADHAPASLKARQFAQEQPDLLIPTDRMGDDGNPISIRASDAITQADAELAHAQSVSGNLFKTAAHCLLGVL